MPCQVSENNITINPSHSITYTQSVTLYNSSEYVAIATTQWVENMSNYSKLQLIWIGLQNGILSHDPIMVRHSTLSNVYNTSHTTYNMAAAIFILKVFNNSNGISNSYAFKGEQYCILYWKLTPCYMCKLIFHTSHKTVV